MKNFEIQTFINAIFDLDAREIVISQELENHIVLTHSISDLEAQSYVESLLPKVYQAVNQRIQSHSEEFTTPEYVICSYDSDKLIRSSLVSDEEAEKIEVRIKWRDNIKELLKKISWRDFEFLARNILLANKISGITITKAIKDQGIDFWGYSDNALERLTRFQNDLRFRIVGQVKHSDNNVKVNHAKISSFGTELNRLRKENPPNYFKDLPDDFFHSPLPLVGLFITNSLYFPKAKDFAKEYGIVIWNGNQISEDLAIPELISKISGRPGKLSLKKLINLIAETENVTN